ncbi:Uncharacterised protein [Mycobacteroides abscessus subsp. abscessus]|nr:Uncharacterised protein [Mycobacteroides abscessus subsp. abscessus]
MPASPTPAASIIGAGVVVGVAATAAPDTAWYVPITVAACSHMRA